VPARLALLSLILMRGGSVEVIDTVGVAVLVAAVGFILARLGKERFEAVEAGLSDLRRAQEQLRSDLGGRIESVDAGLRAELKSEIDAVRSDIRRVEAKLEAKLDAAVDSIRSDITQVALAVGVQRPPRR
jgi:vacuolar-type H+-ATPase subunit I/STV1